MRWAFAASILFWLGVFFISGVFDHPQEENSHGYYIQGQGAGARGGREIESRPAAAGCRSGTDTRRQAETQASGQEEGRKNAALNL